MRTITLHADDIGKGNLILVNCSHPIDYENVKENLTAFRPEYPDILLERQTVNMLAHAIAAVNCAGQIVPVSGYRSIGEQQSLYNDSLRKNGREFTQKFVAVPGCSEHHTGLAVDLGENKPDIDFICPSFPYTGICQTFRERSARYGFIERYPEGKEQFTHIAHEPWHFRYVGYPHSQLMKDKELTLEEYINYLKEFPYDSSHLQFRAAKRNFEICHVPVLPGCPVDIDIPDNTLYWISGNNMDGFVVTLEGSPV